MKPLSEVDPFEGDRWALPDNAAEEWKHLYRICHRVRNGDLVWEDDGKIGPDGKRDGWDHELGLRGYIAIRRLYERLEQK